MAHVELSLSGAFVPQARTPAEAEFAANLDRWSDTVTAADEPCLILDPGATVLAVSASCCALLGLGDAAGAVGKPLLSGALRLVDFTENSAELDESEVERIAPLLAIRSRQLARGLLRVQAGDDGPPVTVDAVATPLTEQGSVVASLTFFAPVRY